MSGSTADFGAGQQITLKTKPPWSGRNHILVPNEATETYEDCGDPAMCREVRNPSSPLGGVPGEKRRSSMFGRAAGSNAGEGPGEECADILVGIC